MLYVCCKLQTVDNLSADPKWSPNTILIGGIVFFSIYGILLLFLFKETIG